MVYNTPPVLKKQRKINTLSSVFIKNGILITYIRAHLTTGRKRLQELGNKGIFDKYIFHKKLYKTI